jgi:glutamine phosphoribosylpyrophosphate amidotransferase
MDLDFPLEKSRCFFETVYFADRRSELFGQISSVQRFRLGQKLAQQDKNIFLNTGDTVVLPIPASSADSAE